MSHSISSIAVVGSGIAGLAAAHRVRELAPEVRLLIFERNKKLGGVLKTVTRGPYQIEQSVDNFITTLPYGLDLCRRLGLDDQLVQTNPKYRRTYVVHRNRLHLLPDGFMMMAPTRMWPLAVTPILSPVGKLRAGLEYFLPCRRTEGDESMAQFIRRRLGREAFERLVEPLVSAIYAADLERLSVEATLPRFRQMERDHGSLIRAMRRDMAARRRTKRQAETNSGPRYSMFVTLRDGLEQIVDRIAAKLEPEGIRTSEPVQRVVPTETGQWIVQTERDSETVNAVVLATPSFVTADLLRDVDTELADELQGIEHSGTAIVSVAFDDTKIGRSIHGMGAVVPKVANSPIIAISFSSHKYPHRAPEGKTLLRVFVGGARAPELAEMEDDRLVPLVLEQLKVLLRTEGEPEMIDVAHWPRTMPQYHVGHKELVARIESRVEPLTRLELAGCAYRGVGMPDCIHSGEAAVEKILNL
ncbi:MAG: protoporphyrinogen oxidase [Planctomycetia bacterium]|jgi:oxygen-dependent protoporphyrinogen oxidase